MPSEAKICRKIKDTQLCKDRIGALPDDLLLQILSLVSTKDAVTSMILSKRWLFVWTMIPKMEFDFTQKADPTSLPKSLYTCKTLVKLTLSGNILVDVPTKACLQSLESLDFKYVKYKDEDSHVRFLKSCPVLKHLSVKRLDKDDNMTRFSVKVPSLQSLTYESTRDYLRRSLVIDSPGLKHVKIFDTLGDSWSIHVQNMPCLDVAVVDAVSRSDHHPDEKFMRSFSSVKILYLILIEVACCSTIYFSRLIEFKLRLYKSKYWLEPLMLLLCNAPKLKVLMIDSNLSRNYPLSWNQPSSVPKCLLAHLEIFEWRAYGGRIEEKQFVAYILANSKCLKKVGISPTYSCSDDEKQKIMEDLESMYRVSTSSQLLFSAPFAGMI